MINNAKITLYQTLVYREKAATNFDMASPPALYRANDKGRNMIAWAKMMGITPAAFTFKRNILPYTTVLFISYNSFGILNRDSSGSLHQQNTHNNNQEQEYNFNQKCNQSALSVQAVR